MARRLAGNRPVPGVCMAGADLGRSVDSVAPRLAGDWIFRPHMDRDVSFRAQDMADARRSIRSGVWHPREIRSDRNPRRACGLRRVRGQWANGDGPPGSPGLRRLLSGVGIAAEMAIATARCRIASQRRHQPLTRDIRHHHAIDGNVRRCHGDPGVAARPHGLLRGVAGARRCAAGHHQYPWSPRLLRRIRRRLPPDRNVDRALF